MGLLDPTTGLPLDTTDPLALKQIEKEQEVEEEVQQETQKTKKGNKKNKGKIRPYLLNGQKIEGAKIKPRPKLTPTAAAKVAGARRAMKGLNLGLKPPVLHQNSQPTGAQTSTSANSDKSEPAENSTSQPAPQPPQNGRQNSPTITCD